MARVRHSETITLADVSGTLKALSGVQVFVYTPGTTTTVSIYGQKSGGTPIANPITTDSSGRVNFFAETGDYDIRYVDTQIPARIADQTVSKTFVDPIVETVDIQDGAVTPAKRTPIVFRTAHTYAITGEIIVPSGDTNFLPPFYVPVASGQTVKLAEINHKINSGTSVTFKMQRNGSDIAGFTSLVSTTGGVDSDPADVTLNDGDRLAVVVTAVTGTPKNLTVTVVLEHTI